MGVAVCVAAIVCAIVYGCYCLFLFVYFSSRKFSRLKVFIKENIHDCNELNLHIENLKHSYDKYYKQNWMAVYPLLSIKVSGIINERNFLNTKRQTISIIVQDRSVLMQGINHLNIYANTLKSVAMKIV